MSLTFKALRVKEAIDERSAGENSKKRTSRMGFIFASRITSAAMVNGLLSRYTSGGAAGRG